MMVQELLTAKNSVVVTVNPTTTLAEAARTMVDHRIGAVVVADDAERLLGIVTERDLTRAIVDYSIGLMEQRVEDVMTYPVVTSTPDESVVEALNTMTSRHVRHLPILDRDRLAGMISIRDVTGKWIELLELENRQLRDPVS
jgi:CBS domain-containing protein